MFAPLTRWLTSWLSQPIGTTPLVATDPAALAAALQPGDVLLVDGKSRMSGVIQLLTRSSWSHAALYVGRRAELAGGTAELIEADISEGVRAVPLAEYAQLHTRICRPLGLAAAEREAVIGYVIDRLGCTYDLKNIFDLARRLLPIAAARRNDTAVLGSNDPQRVICSTLIAQAFQSIGFAVLPDVNVEASDPAERQTRVIRIPRHASCIAPRDFDISPFFGVIKPVPAHRCCDDAAGPVSGLGGLIHAA